ncbi:MAG: class I SAM-dependent methyltransferase [Chitinophagales bacterium]
MKVLKKIFGKAQIEIPDHSQEVRKFYNKTTDQFLEVYGEIIQAFRTKNVDDYLDYTISSAQLVNAEKILDAGCGVCGPSIYFAKKVNGLKIDACTISDIQFEKGTQNIKQARLDDRLHVHQLDYHTIDEVFQKETYDRILFLESFGHSDNKERLIDACWELLKPGGMAYIKDLFRRIDDDEWEQLRIDKICAEIDMAYKYKIGDLNNVLDKIRSKGFLLKFVKIPEIELSQFEHLTISNDFQTLFGIGKIDTWTNYVFPIDFFEILIQKPEKISVKDAHLYFMNK